MRIGIIFIYFTSLAMLVDDNSSNSEVIFFRAANQWISWNDLEQESICSTSNTCIIQKHILDSKCKINN